MHSFTLVIPQGDSRQGKDGYLAALRLTALRVRSFWQHGAQRRRALEFVEEAYAEARLEVGEAWLQLDNHRLTQADVLGSTGSKIILSGSASCFWRLHHGLALGILRDRLANPDPWDASRDGLAEAWRHSVDTYTEDVILSPAIRGKPHVIASVRDIADQIRGLTGLNLTSALFMARLDPDDVAVSPQPEEVEGLRAHTLRLRKDALHRGQALAAQVQRVMQPDMFRTLAGHFPVEVFMHALWAYLNLRLTDHVLGEMEPERAQQLSRRLPLQLDFWQWVFRSLPAQCPELTPEVRQAACAIIGHPRTYRRMTFTAGQRPMVRALGHYAWLWANTRPPLAEKNLLGVLQTSSWHDILPTLAAFAHDCLIATDNKDDQAYAFLAKQGLLLLKNCEDIILQLQVEQGGLATPLEAQLQEDQAMAELATEIAQEQAEEAAVAATAQAALQRQLTAVPVVPTSRTTVNDHLGFRLVTNWGSGDMKTLNFSCPPNAVSLANELETCLGHFSIPRESIARALLHYVLEVPTEIKTMRNKETIGGVPWHKIKRQNVRIYVRQIAGDCYFYVMQRRDWQPKDLVEGRF